MERNKKEKKDETAKKPKYKAKDKAIPFVATASEAIRAVKQDKKFYYADSVTEVHLPCAHEHSAMRLIEALKTATSVTDLAFYHKDWSHKELKALKKALLINESITTLNFFGAQWIGSGLILTATQILKLNPRIKHVTFAESVPIRHIVVPEDYISFCEGLKSNRIKITTLKFKYSTLTDDQFRILRDALMVNQSITSFAFENEDLSVASLNYLVSALSVNPRITDLKIIVLRPSIFTRAWGLMANIIQFNNVRTLSATFSSIPKESFEIIGNELVRNTSIVDLDLSGNVPCDTKILGKVLAGDKTIETLRLDYAEITDVQFSHLDLGNNTTLKRISLNGNPMSGFSLFWGLRSNKALKSISLQGLKQRIDSEELRNMFLVNNTLTELNLYDKYTTLPLVLVSDLAKALKVNKGLQKLSIAMRSAPYNEIVEFIDALKSNETLTHLTLGNLMYIAAYTKPESAPTMDVLIADLLKTNRSLVYIDKTQDYPDITAALKRNRELRVQNVRNALMLMSMILKRPSSFVLPLEIWYMVFKDLTFPGVAIDFGGILRRSLK